MTPSPPPFTLNSPLIDPLIPLGGHVVILGEWYCWFNGLQGVFPRFYRCPYHDEVKPLHTAPGRLSLVQALEPLHDLWRRYR